MVNCPVCKGKMYIKKTVTTCREEFDGKDFDYDTFFECPTCKLFYHNDMNNWDMAYQRIEVLGKWYYFYTIWHPIKPLTPIEKHRLTIPLTNDEQKKIKQMLHDNTIISHKPFIFR
jgi:uncharacterized protein YbaR (Trm112 family)